MQADNNIGLGSEQLQASLRTLGLSFQDIQGMLESGVSKEELVNYGNIIDKMRHAENGSNAINIVDRSYIKDKHLLSNIEKLSRKYGIIFFCGKVYIVMYFFVSIRFHIRYFLDLLLSMCSYEKSFL
jgi:hypothetical protein